MILDTRFLYLISELVYKRFNLIYGRNRVSRVETVPAVAVSVYELKASPTQTPAPVMLVLIYCHQGLLVKTVFTICWLCVRTCPAFFWWLYWLCLDYTSDADVDGWVWTMGCLTSGVLLRRVPVHYILILTLTVLVAGKI